MSEKVKPGYRQTEVGIIPETSLLPQQAPSGDPRRLPGRQDDLQKRPYRHCQKKQARSIITAYIANRAKLKKGKTKRGDRFQICPPRQNFLGVV